MSFTALSLSTAEIEQQRADTPLYLSDRFNRLYVDKVTGVSRLKGAGVTGVVGVKEGVLVTPVSAPFGGFWPVQDALPDISDLGTSLIDYAKTVSAQGIRLVLPPTCYDKNWIESQQKALLAAGFKLAYADTNHSLDLQNDFATGLRRGARRSLRRAGDAGLKFSMALTPAEQRTAYDVIQLNRQQKANPLHLSFEDLLQVGTVTDVDFFKVDHKGSCVAAAVVYRVTPAIAQVIYWGNDVRQNALNSVHFLASHLFDHYAPNYAVLDIGPSSIDGVLDEGLADFKESIGCFRTLKSTLVYGRY